MRVGSESERLDRQRAQRLSFLSLRQAQRQRGCIMRKRPGSTWRAGNGASGRQMEFLEALDEVIEQGSLAAEEMGAAGDVEEEAVTAILKRPWRGGGRIAR